MEGGYPPRRVTPLGGSTFCLFSHVKARGRVTLLGLLSPGGGGGGVLDQYLGIGVPLRV